MRDHRQLVVLLVSLALPPALIIVLPSSIALALQIPGELAVRKLGASGGFAVVTGLLICWVSLAVPVAFLIEVMVSRNRVAKALLLGLFSILCIVLVVTGRSQKDRVFVGTFEYGFERSDFYPNGQCWRPPYWLVPLPEIHGRMNSLGSVVTVRFVGDATSIGSYGHMGTYVRQVRVIRVLDVQPARSCLGK
jgi:hypothetical protein